MSEKPRRMWFVHVTVMLALLFALSTVLRSQELPAYLLVAPNEPGSLVGKVTDRVTGAPVSGRRVFAAPVNVGGGLRGIGETRSERDGSFHFERMAPFTYLITTDMVMAFGGLNLGDVNIFPAYFRVEPGQYLAGVVIHPGSVDAAHELGCGYALTAASLTECLQRAVQHSDQAIQRSHGQELWRKYRDAHCGLVSGPEMNLALAREYACRIRLNQARIAELKTIEIPH